MQDRPSSNAAARTYGELRIWQMGMDLCEACYKFTAHPPRDETYGLVSQIRRASVSIPSNIAAGFGRESRGTFAQHLKIAQGSLRELETQLMICCRVTWRLLTMSGPFCAAPMNWEKCCAHLSEHCRNDLSSAS
jgi:four helix bundle protein